MSTDNNVSQTHAEVFGHLDDAWFDTLESIEYLGVAVEDFHKNIIGVKCRLINCKLHYSLNDLKVVKLKLSKGQ